MGETKNCKRCKEDLPIEIFKPRTYFRENGRTYTTTEARCDPCRLIYQREKRALYKRSSKIKGTYSNPHANLDSATKQFLY